MALLVETDLRGNETSPEVSVVPNTLVSINSSEPLRVLAKNGSGGYERAFTMDADEEGEVALATVSFVASSDTIKVKNLRASTAHVTIYGDEA